MTVVTAARSRIVESLAVGDLDEGVGLVEVALAVTKAVGSVTVTSEVARDTSEIVD